MSELRDDKPAEPAPRADGHEEDATRPQIESPAYGWFGDKDDKQPGVLARLGQKLGDMLGDVLGDAAVLEVKTYTSDDLQPIASGAPLSTSGARLRAYTRCELDGDTEACMPTTENGEVDKAVWALHVEMVKQAQAHRTELLKTLLSLFSPRTGS